MGELRMAQQQSMPNNSNADNNGGATQHHQNQRQQQLNKPLGDRTEAHLAKPIFHDFFGGPNNIKPNQNDSSVVVLGPNSPSASFAASDLASERRVGNHLEGVPFYGPRSDISGPEISNKIAGSKRSNSDSTFMGSSRDGAPQIRPESLEGSQLMKLLRSGSRVERLRRSNDDEATFGSQQMRPTSASLIFQPPSGASKLDRMVPMSVGSAAQYPPRGGLFTPFVPHVLSDRFREANASPLNISHSAADEGSRTGIKGPGILSSLSAGGGSSERHASGSLPSSSSSRQKGATVNTEPESSTPSGSQHGFTGSRQMTIFYGGQAHVFDDVHPNKADIIMAVAGSNGGSWSTTLSAKSTAKVAGESHLPSGEPELSNTNNATLLRDYRGRLCIPGSSSLGVGFGDRMSIPAGGISVSNASKDMRNSVQVAGPNSKEKLEQ